MINHTGELLKKAQLALRPFESYLQK